MKLADTLSRSTETGNASDFNESDLFFTLTPSLRFRCSLIMLVVVIIKIKVECR